MEQNNLVIAVNVPYQVEISATGIPLHKAVVEFCIHRSDISYNFPAKMVTDDKFVFTITDAVESLMNSSLDYRLYVYYGNARFEADTGTFNLVDSDAFEAEVLQPDLQEKIKNLGPEKEDKPKPKAKAKPKAKSKTTKPTVTATAPVPTPTPTATTTLKEAKRLLGERSNEPLIPGMKRIVESVKKNEPKVVEESDDINTKVKNALANLGKTATPSIELEATPTTEGASTPKFFAEVEKMRQINEKRRQKKAQKETKETKKTNPKNEAVKNAIRKTKKK